LCKPNGDKAKFFQFTIDTGADYTLISRADAMYLGIEYSRIRQKEINAEVANCTPMRTKLVRLSMEIGGRNFLVPVLVASGQVGCLLGRIGVFEHFDVLFREREQEVIFKSA
jgi:predicted aspartyl protease